MKKSNSNDNHQDGQEQSKKLYRSISESARRLDDAHSCAHYVGDLFTPTLQIQRSRFQEYCERLIFSDPTLFGRKAEELLWRKCYYDVISAAKRLKKKEFTPKDISNIETHINAGVGHYHHFILRLQYQFQLDVKDVVDFAMFQNILKKSNTCTSKPELEWAQQSVHRCLIYLGDLNRYKLEIYPTWDPGLSIRCYLRAIEFKPEYGIPHNQMGTLASNQNRVLDAVYHYICCLSCKVIFDGTENNLLRLFEKNSHTLEEFPSENKNADCIVQLEPADHIKRLVARFLFLVEMWYFNKNFADVYTLCHQTNVDLQECLSYLKSVSNDSEESPTDADSIHTADSVSSPAHLSDDTVFKIVVICLLCVSKVQKLHNNQISTVVAFTLAVYSQLLQIITDHLSENLLPFIPEEPDPKIINGVKYPKVQESKTKGKIRRRRKKKLSSDESDVSDLDEEIHSNSDASTYGSDKELMSSSDSDEDDILTNKLSGRVEEKNAANITQQLDFNKSVTELARKVRQIDPNVVLDVVSEEKLLSTVKILSEWFIGDVEIVKSCAKSTRSLLKQIVQLLNFLNIDFQHERLSDMKYLTEQDKGQQKCLSEELALKGVNIQNNQFVDSLHHNKHLSIKEETFIRMSRLVSFGHSLAKIPETCIHFNDGLQQFTLQEVEIEETNGVDILNGGTGLNDTDSENTLTGMKIPTDNNDSNGQLTKMKHMGQLWLAAEVRALENRVKSKTSLSPYLVLDVDSLIQSTAIIKHLVNSKKFIVVIPSAVVSALDDLKRIKSEARDAIRWLELQFHHGNRFCRAQRPQERTSLPFIKYPKKKDKELFTYIQIIECCHHFVQQQNLSNLVTLLIGRNAISNSENREISYTGLAHSAGINVEVVTSFYEKWKKNVKGKK
ncbi:hypothetical protein PPYR_06477 [Photinus pyralis]|uniref:PIN domain-containing protein n=1 Tax=Photinus pyralis TaxID=7054 RepID=A0A1Y1L2J1_PHOPY|nr:protein SMG5 [Photinus pyralis]KAB0800738.1 hypothetical protein PPYR_06477 [Photinus pyralis]